jgi:hypothetical protein
MNFLSRFISLTHAFGNVAGVGITTGAMFDLAYADRKKNEDPELAIAKPLAKMALAALL